MRTLAIVVVLAASISVLPSPSGARADGGARRSEATLVLATHDLPSRAAAAGRLADRARGLARRVQTELGSARDLGARATASCYDNVLSQINSTARHLDHYRSDLRRGRVVEARHALVMRTFGRRLGELDRLAMSCGGADMPMPDQTLVEVTIERADRPVVVRSYRMPARNASSRE